MFQPKLPVSDLEGENTLALIRIYFQNPDCCSFPPLLFCFPNECSVFLVFKQQERKTSPLICSDFCLSNYYTFYPVEPIKTLHTFKKECTGVYSLYRKWL